MSPRDLARLLRDLFPLLDDPNGPVALDEELTGHLAGVLTRLIEGADGLHQRCAGTTGAGLEQSLKRWAIDFRAAVLPSILLGVGMDRATLVPWLRQADAFIAELDAVPLAGAAGATASGHGESDPYVTLDQAAALVNRSKRTLRRRFDNADMPEPDVTGKTGEPHEWRWSRLRPWLEETFRRKLPGRPPTLRRTG